MSELISGKEAWIAKANKKDVQYRITGTSWYDLTDNEFINWDTYRFLSEDSTYQFRLKPKTITINGVELEKPKAIEKPTVTSILLCFNGESERNVFLNTLMNRNF